MIAGAPFDIEEIDQKTSTVVWSWFNGSEGGNALADVLLGNVNPSGKLPWTMPKNLEDSPAHATNSFPGDDTVSYEEGILVGYRWFDTKNMEPLYPFGYGLSYTTFELANAKVDKNSAYAKDDVIQFQCRCEEYRRDLTEKKWCRFMSLKSIQSRTGSEELKGFQKAIGFRGNQKLYN